MSALPTDVDDLAEHLIAGGRAVLARAITLSESTLPSDRRTARALLAAVWAKTGGALRIAVTGPPGVGKSTFIDSLGLRVVDDGAKVAVLAVDPSSPLGGGAILGDKTRMSRLSANAAAYIRPSPTSGAAGGVAVRTREAIAFAEAAGYGVVLVETVGAGQSEAAVAEMTDVFLLLMAPGGGDELQGVKRGVMELADLVLVNKCDGDFVGAARRTRTAYASALRLMRKRDADPEGFPAVLEMSAVEDQGIGDVWQKVQELDRFRREQGHRAARRRRQAARWVRDTIEEDVLSRLGSTGQAEIPESLGERIASGTLDPESAAAEALRLARS